MVHPEQRRPRSPRKRRVPALALALAAGLLAPVAEAAPPNPEPPAPTSDAPSAAARTSPKRALPDYDGRPEHTSAGQAALWVPRVILFPVYAVTEYVVRRPLGALVSAAERGRWIETIADVFTFGPNNNIGVVPTALFDFGLRSSVGVYAWWDEFLARENQLRLHAAWGGPDWLRLTLADRVMLDENDWVKFRFEASSRPDWLFYGIGPRSLEANRSRYGIESLDFALSFHLEPTKHTTFEGWVGVKPQRFRLGYHCCDDPPIFARVARGQLPMPPGIVEGYTAARQGLSFAIDSRRPPPAPGSGVRAQIDAEHDIDLRDPGPGRWIKYGGSIGGYLDVNGKNRVLGLTVATRFVDPLGDGAVPFTELASLGGDQFMLGYLPNRLLGRSAAAAVLEYRYPIWSFLDGTLQVAVGNVFGPHLQDFEPRLLRLSFDAGIRTAGSRDHALNLLIGSGTETFADGARLNQVRFMFGATRGF